MRKMQELMEQDSCWNKAGANEPVFVLRAKDELASSTVLAWVQQANSRGVHQDKVAGAIDWVVMAEMWKLRKHIIKDAAEMCHEVVRLFLESIGREGYPAPAARSWEDLPQDQKDVEIQNIETLFEMFDNGKEPPVAPDHKEQWVNHRRVVFLSQARLAYMLGRRQESAHEKRLIERYSSMRNGALDEPQAQAKMALREELHRQTNSIDALANRGLV